MSDTLDLEITDTYENSSGSLEGTLNYSSVPVGGVVIAAANVCVLGTASGAPVGFINLPPNVSVAKGVNLGTLLAACGAIINNSGVISGPNGISGLISGFGSLTATQKAGLKALTAPVSLETIPNDYSGNINGGGSDGGGPNG